MDVMDEMDDMDVMDKNGQMDDMDVMDKKWTTWTFGLVNRTSTRGGQPDGQNGRS